MKRIPTIALFLLAFVTAQSQTKNFIDQPYIEVNGNADTAITPDEIYIKIIISERDTKDRIPVEEQETKWLLLCNLRASIQKEIWRQAMWEATLNTIS